VVGRNLFSSEDMVIAAMGLFCFNQSDKNDSANKLSPMARQAVNNNEIHDPIVG
jgi:hypothetical protein